MVEQIEEIYRLYYQELYRFIRARCVQPDMVDDIIQTTFLEALKNMEQYRGEASLKTWLFGIAKHQLYRHYRKAGKPLQNIDDVTKAQAEEASHRDDVENKMLAEDLLAQINKLSPPLNEIMWLRLVRDLSFDEIAKRVGKSANYCRVNYYRVRQKLRKEMAP
ncbi:RNA polymerase sigma factor [Paenibacillus senegalensis]|uniref:RNA polymerase sigma factor n=1 Tax=Paenibacillus senegalensis TaxID=1465766 RepID=UPI00028A06A3|nr:sigma-70 family RNA polymerase sigma factor [Paenibacillus senegalensis]